MNWKTWWPVVAGGICLIGASGLVYLTQPTRNAQRMNDREVATKASDIPKEAKRESVPSDWVNVGGVKRPPSDVRVSQEPESGNRPKGIDRPVPVKREGVAPMIAADTNPQTKLVSQALKDGKNPERYSSFIVPKSFDKEAFDKDPEGYSKKYAEDIEPGRVYATAQPGQGVKPIRSEGSRFHRVKQGETVRLIVEAAPFAPVSFTSRALGNFSNSLSSITVVAGSDGKATAEFTASRGTKDKVDILAASPVTSEQVNFVVMVSLGA